MPANLFCLGSLIFALVATGCDSGQPRTAESMTATLNGKPWSAAATFVRYSFDDTGESGFGVTGTVGNPRNVCPYPNYCEVISLGTYPEPASLGRREISPIYTILEGDAVVREYGVAEGYNWIDLNGVSDREVSGQFEATFVNMDAPYDTLRFRNGAFTARPFSEVFPGGAK